MDIRINYKNFLVILVIFIILISIGCITNSDIKDNTENKKTIIYGSMDIDSIYPYSIKLNNRYVLLSNIYNGLVEFNKIFK